MLNTNFLCNLFGCKEVETSSGYPPYGIYWEVESYCTRCGTKYKTRDDLFAPVRPEHFRIDLDFRIKKGKE